MKILVAVIISTTIIGVFAFRMGNKTGLAIGYEKGDLNGYSKGHINGYEMGYDEGEKEGYDEGYNSGYDVGYDAGFEPGFGTGYSSGHEVGFNLGNESGLQEGIIIGNQTGFEYGYSCGLDDASGHNFSMRDPSFYEMRTFLRNDKTDEFEWTEEFDCEDFSRVVKTNALNLGIHVHHVTIEFNDSAHAIVGFNTTDRGFIFIEPQTDDRVRVELNKCFYDRKKYRAPDFDDIIKEYTIFP